MTSGTAQPDPARATTWLSQGFECLLAEVVAADAADAAADERGEPRPPDVDIAIVGSGYGGAVALSRLAGCAGAPGGTPLRVCLLERGSEYLGGMFPSRFADLAGHVRFSAPGAKRARGVLDGLFDVRLGAELSALVGNGLGGGSLINAGVMAWPHSSVWQDAGPDAWPDAIRNDTSRLEAIAGELRAELFARPAPTGTRKGAALAALAAAPAPEGLGAHRYTPLDITVADADGPNAQNVLMQRCVGCGDCATGCNHGAKASLDLTLLAGARGVPGVRIVTGATVLWVQREASAWELAVVHTDDKLRKREGKEIMLRAERVILAAGSFGSTEILLRSARHGLALSPRLGERFSANGDGVAALYDTGRAIGAVADEGVAYERREAGPTIVAMIDARHGDAKRDYVVQDLGVPGPLRRVFEETFATAQCLAALGRSDDAEYGKTAVPDANAVASDVTERSLLVALIGRDGADGRLRLADRASDKDAGDDASDDDAGDGAVHVEWPALARDSGYAARQAALEALAGGAPALGGEVLPNPAWRLIPAALQQVLGARDGPLVTVHPLGGCAMGESGAKGVVDDCGRVYRGAGSDTHAGLVVLDGSIVPTSLGINPALTIAALARRAVDRLREKDWGLAPPPAAAPGAPVRRPILRPPPVPRTPRPTEAEFTERLRGRLCLARPGRPPEDCRVELTLWFRPLPLRELSARDGTRRLELDPARSRLRIATGSRWHGEGLADDAGLVLEAPLEGTLAVFGHAASSPWQRRWRGLWAWLCNRGVRDTVQSLRAWWHKRRGNLVHEAIAAVRACLRLQDDCVPRRIWRYVVMACRLATRAGDERRLEYALTAGAATRCADGWSLPDDASQRRIAGAKTLTYGHAANPWQQLQSTCLAAFPHWAPVRGDDATLQVHLPYFGEAAVPLLRVTAQEDMPSALADLAGFGLYLLRTLLHGHVWSLRKPDPPSARTPARLPGALPGLPAPEVVEFAVAPPRADGTPVLARLTRYRQAHVTGDAPPVLLIHGYSASGTTFAHPAVPERGLGGWLCRRGRDVWVLDLRSSAGMPTARVAWAFEDMAASDIPLAVEHVVRATGWERIDVVAHCMGSAMLAMGLLDPDAGLAGAPWSDAAGRAQRALPRRIRRLVMSQVGPVLTMAPANVLRAYVMRWLKPLLPLGGYAFRPAEGGPQQEALDRLLATVPYPPGEFELENPFWPLGALRPWVGTRHRMDALYGGTFKLANMAPEVLERIDDFFGPLSIETVTQVIHFARLGHVTDRRGVGRYVDRAHARARLQFPILSLHSTENGLVDVATAARMRAWFAQLALPDERERRAAPPPDHRVRRLARMGHQDSLIGRTAPRVYARIGRFLDEGLARADARAAGAAP